MRTIVAFTVLLLCVGSAHASGPIETAVKADWYMGYAWRNDGGYLYATRKGDDIYLHACTAGSGPCTSPGQVLVRDAVDFGVYDLVILDNRIYFVFGDEGPGSLASVGTGCIKAGHCAETLAWHSAVEGYRLVVHPKKNMLYVETDSGLQPVEKFGDKLDLGDPYEGTQFDYHDYYLRGEELYFSRHSANGVWRRGADGTVAELCKGEEEVSSISVGDNGRLVFIYKTGSFSQSIKVSNCKDETVILYKGTSNESIENAKLSDKGSLLFQVRLGNGKYELRMLREAMGAVH